MRTIYIAKLLGKDPSLIKVTVSKETEKTFLVEESESVLGWSEYVGKRINKSEQDWFDTPGEALAYLVERAENRVAFLVTKLDEARQVLAELRQLAEKSE